MPKLRSSSRRGGSAIASSKASASHPIPALLPRHRSADPWWAKPLRQLHQPGWSPDKATYAALIRWCARKKALPDGLRLHAHMVANHRESNPYLANLLLHMYGRCGSVPDAVRAFRALDRPNVFSWTSVVAALARNGLPSEAIGVYWCMEADGVRPSRFTFFPVLSSCVDLRDVAQGRRIHGRIAELGLDADVGVATALVKMYGKCGSPQEALAVFHKVQRRDIVLWNAMIAVYSQNGYGKEALQLFERLHLEGLKPDKITFLSILQACVNLGDLGIGQAMHARIVEGGFDSDIAVENALLHMYNKCGSLKDVQAVFHGMYRHDVISWTAMITAYARNGCANEALHLFKQMALEGTKPNKVTFLSIVDGCGSFGSLGLARKIHQLVIRSGFGSEIAVRTALVNMYGKCGSPQGARAVFDEFTDRDVILWTAMIMAYAQNNHSKEALELFRQMELEGVKPNRVTFIAALDACASLPSVMHGKEIHKLIVLHEYDSDVAVQNSLVNMYAKCGRFRDARMVFCEMHERNVVSWTAMLAACVQNGYYYKALEVLRQMNSGGVEPNSVTIVNALNACGSLASLEIGRVIHQSIIAGRFNSDVVVMNALMNMYGKCGSLRDARSIFDEMSERDLISWNTMVAVHAQNGRDIDALEVFEQMELEHIRPDEITFIHILDACNHACLLDKGCRYFVCMISVYEIGPKEMHYTCMSHLIRQAGYLDEAESFIVNMHALLPYDG